MPFSRPPAADDPHWPRASRWLAGPSSGRPHLEVLGVPCSVGSLSPSQAFETPGAVRDALARLSPFDPAASRDLDRLAVHDAGDLPVATLGLEPAIEAIAEAARELDRDRVHAFLGGDNAVTRPLAAGRCGPDLSAVGVLTFDAHHDVRTLANGPGNGTPIRGLIEQHGLPGHNVAQIGIGWFTNSAAYRQYCDDQGICTFLAADVHDRGVDAVLDDALARLQHCTTLYVDVDVDVLDAAYAPACPGARPGGLRPDQLLQAVRRCGSDSRVVAADFVEVDATADADGRTVMVTAQLLLAFAAGVAARNEEGTV